MRLLVVGGAGKVASLVLPQLARQHQIRIFDLRLPESADPSWETRVGTLDDFDAVREAATGCDALLFMAMNSKRPWGELASVVSAYDVNVKGLHLAHWAAHQAGIQRVVVTSSLSVYAPRGLERYPDESIPPDGEEFYGFTKRLGEEVSKNAAQRFGQTVTSLRLCFPWPDDSPPPAATPGERVGVEGSEFRTATFTRARDVASAILLALEHEHTGWEAFAISGNLDQRVVPTGKARRELGWLPTAEAR
jgi:nucleoside-diphosphate-sugar epimerase